MARRNWAGCRVCVVGLGFVGLPTAAMLAAAGHDVVGVDTRPQVLEALARGRTVLREPGLEGLVARVVAAGRLAGSAYPVGADAFILAVPTPLRGAGPDGADLTAVTAAAVAVAAVLRPGDLVVVESTCPPGTTAGIVRRILEDGSGLRAGGDFLLAHCPERVLPGRILEEIVHNDRIIGGVDRESAAAAAALYAGFVRGETLLTDATTAELVKLMENTGRDVNIALANEFALVAEHLGVDVWEAIELANRHPRVRFLKPGPGVGGHCIAVDPWFVVAAAAHLTPLIAAGRGVNDGMPRHVRDLVAEVLGGLPGRRVVALGLTYKANVDDTRGSPAAEVVARLRRAGCVVDVHDPLVAPGAVDELAVDADALVLLVDHEAYAALDPCLIGRRMRRRIAVDACNFLPPAAWTEAGFGLVRLGDGRPRAAAPALAEQSV